MPQISVLMPVRDGARWIGESIDSVLAQTFGDFELLIIDDGSADDTPRIVTDYAARDARISVTTQKAIGLVAALNAGLAMARAPFIARLDADDIAEPTRFAEQIEAMTRNSRLAVLGSWVSEIDENGQRCGVRRPAADAKLLMKKLKRGNPMIHSTIMLRTAIIREADGYRAAFPAAEDFDLWLRLSERGDVANLARELVRYRVHPDSVSAQKAMLQMFSTRLARRSAKLRRTGRPDPADELDAPIDLWCDTPPAYAEDVAIYRLLAWAHPETIPPAFRGHVPDFSRLKVANLTRRERRFAQSAILRYLAAHPGRQAGLWFRLIALRPLGSARLIWRHLFGRSTVVCDR